MGLLKPEAIQVALDSSMVIALFEFKVDVFQEIVDKLGTVEWMVPVQVVKELKALQENSQKMKVLNYVDGLFKKWKVQVVTVEAKTADLALLELAKQGVWVATNDKPLKHSILKWNGRVLFLRGRRTVEVA